MKGRTTDRGTRMLGQTTETAHRSPNWLCGPKWTVLLGIIVVGYVFIDVLLVLPGLTTKQSDFGAFFYPAARAILEGKSPYLVSGLNYPPLFPLILAPLALLPYTGVRILWFALCHLFAAAAGYWA